MDQQEALIAAAQYVRMSTDKQIYSTANQMAAIASYAALNGFRIVQTYADEGRSGLHLKGRDALQDMLRDVLSGESSYQAVLVYDVSRWGRFQDADESAHYEFLCRRAGVAIHYCAELFENDGSLASTIMKNVRRAMAGEFSRDLSDKVYQAQCRLAAQGFKMGGSAPYGFRRVMLDERGAFKCELKPGQVKNYRSDRVILVPGPDDEIATVKRIYRLSGERGLTDRRIAELLNRAKVQGTAGRAWNRYMVRDVLTSERYIGTYVYNRSSSKLGGRKMLNPPTDWIRCEGAFEAIVPQRAFDKAQAARGRNRHIFSDKALIDHAKRLLERDGKLSSWSIMRSPNGPSLSTYRKRFGSLDRVYELAGYQLGRFEAVSVGRGLVHHAVGLLETASTLLRCAGAQVAEEAERSGLIINDAVWLGVTVARYIRSKESYWRITLRAGAGFDFVLVGLMNPANSAIDRLYLLPRKTFPHCGKTTFSERGSRKERFRLSDLSHLYSAIGLPTGGEMVGDDGLEPPTSSV